VNRASRTGGPWPWALDGTKFKANASKHKATSYERMAERAEEVEVAGFAALARAAAAPSRS
jgi:hypothetical protein